MDKRKFIFQEQKIQNFAGMIFKKKATLKSFSIKHLQI